MRLLEKIDNYLQEQNAFDPDDTETIRKKIERGLDAPHAKVNVSRLGGKENTAIMIKATLDPKNEWTNNIFENSRYFQVSFYMDTSKSNLEMFAKSHKIEGKKMRKQKAKNVDEAIRKINTWISKVK